MKKINNWVIRTFGLRGSWSWAKKQMLNGAIIKRKATTGTYKIAIDDDKNRLLVATWDHLDQSPVWERCPRSRLRTGDHVNGLRMFMMRNAIIMSLMNALRYTGSSVDAPPP